MEEEWFWLWLMSRKVNIKVRAEEWQEHDLCEPQTCHWSSTQRSWILRVAGFFHFRHKPWVSSEALWSPIFSFLMLAAILSFPFLGESWVEQWELGTVGGRDVGWEKEGHCCGYLSLSGPFFSLKGDQMQWARQRERIHGSQLCVSENTLSLCFREHVEFYD